PCLGRGEIPRGWPFSKPSSAPRASSSCTPSSPRPREWPCSGTRALRQPCPGSTRWRGPRARAAAPSPTRVPVLCPQGSRTAVPGLKALEGPARTLGLKLQPVGARSADELKSAFAPRVKGGAQPALVFNTVPFNSARGRIVELAGAHRLPTMYQGRFFTEAGGLISYYPKPEDYWRRPPAYGKKILKGPKPADLPVEQPTKFELIINLKTAKALGLTIPQSILTRADEVIAQCT